MEVCSALSHSLGSSQEESECSVLLDVGKAFRAETRRSLCCAWWLGKVCFQDLWGFLY